MLNDDYLSIDNERALLLSKYFLKALSFKRVRG